MTTRKLRQAERITDLQFLTSRPEFQRFMLRVLNELEGGGVFHQHSLELAKRATRADFAHWLKTEMLAGDANSVWQIERERMRRRREEQDGRSSSRADRDGESPDDDANNGGARDE